METNISTDSKQKIIGPIKLLKEASNFFTKNIRSFLSLAVAGPIASIILQIFVFLFAYLIITNIKTVGIPALATFGIVSFILYVGTIIFLIAINIALLKRIHYVSSGHTTYPSFKKAVSEALPYILPIIGLHIIQTLFVIGASILIIIPGLMALVYTLFAFFARTLDDKKGREAILFSIDIVWGRFWAVVGRLLLVIIVLLVIMFGISLLFSLIASALNWLIGQSDVTIILLNSIYSLFINTLLSTLAIIIFYKLYENLKGSIINRTRKYDMKKWIAILSVFGGIVFVSYIAMLIYILIYKVQYRSYDLRLGLVSRNYNQNSPIKIKDSTDMDYSNKIDLK
jgi:hypothetical protein